MAPSVKLWALAEVLGEEDYGTIVRLAHVTRQSEDKVIANIVHHLLDQGWNESDLRLIAAGVPLE